MICKITNSHLLFIDKIRSLKCNITDNAKWTDFFNFDIIVNMISSRGVISYVFDYINDV